MERALLVEKIHGVVQQEPLPREEVIELATLKAKRLEKGRRPLLRPQGSQRYRPQPHLGGPLELLVDNRDHNATAGGGPR